MTAATRRQVFGSALMVAALCGLAGPAAGQVRPSERRSATGPAGMIQAVYRPYIEASQPGARTRVPDPLLASRYSRRAAGMIRRMQARCARPGSGELCGPDFDILVGGQDFDIRSVSIRQLTRAAGSASVEARFDNAGTPVRIVFALVQERRRWVIDDLRAQPVGDEPGYSFEQVLRSD